MFIQTNKKYWQFHHQQKQIFIYKTLPKNETKKNKSKYLCIFSRAMQLMPQGAAIFKM